MSNIYRYQLERYRGRGSRYTCPQCHRKGTFTRYIDTYNNNIYVSENVGKCNRIDKCGYHYTPKQYFADNPHKRDDGELVKNTGIFTNSPSPKRSLSRSIDTIPEWVFEYSRTIGVVPDHVRWLVAMFGVERAEEVFNLYEIGSTKDGRTIFWQRDSEDRLRTGKIMAYDTTTGKRKKTAGAIDWVHSVLRREGILPEEWQLSQCLYGEHLLADNPDHIVALVESYKTAHIGAILRKDMVWCATDSLQGLTAERLKSLKGRKVLVYPDEGKGYATWVAKLADISRDVGFSYEVSRFVEETFAKGSGADIGDVWSQESKEQR